MRNVGVKMGGKSVGRIRLRRRQRPTLSYRFHYQLCTNSSAFIFSTHSLQEKADIFAKVGKKKKWEMENR